MPTEIIFNNKYLTNTHQIPNASAEHFKSIFETPLQSFVYKKPSSSFFTFSSISERYLSFKQRKFKNSPGNDNIPAYIYEGLAKFLITPMRHIFNFHENKFSENPHDIK